MALGDPGWPWVSYVELSFERVLTLDAIENDHKTGPKM